MKLYFSPNFNKNLKKIAKNNQRLQIKIQKSLDLLETNLNHPSLRTHKLKGFSTYSSSINMSIRIIYHIKQDTIYLLDIGTHDNIY